MRSRFHRALTVWLISLAAIFAMPVQAQAKLDSAKLSQLLAPIALYPDALLSQILMASTYPNDVAAAAKWSTAHSSLSGDAAVKATEKESWDPSVKSLTAFPSVLNMMGRQPQWTKSLGNAFLAQPDDVMSSVQHLRAQAKKAGTLVTTPQQKVSTETTGNTTIVKIEPANPQIVYVPTYNPAVVYGPWLYPAYPPYYYPPPVGSVFATSVVAGIGFGVGVAAVDSLWGGFDWGHDNVNINVNRYNNINVNNHIDHNGNNVTWQHNGNNVASQHNGANISNTSNNAAARNRQNAPTQSRDTERDHAAQAFQQRTGHAITGYGNAGRSGTAQKDDRSGARPDTAAGLNHDNATTRQAQDQFNARNQSRDANTASMFRGAGDSGDWHQQVQQRGDYAESRGGQFGGDNFGGDRFGGDRSGGGHFGRGRR